MIKIVLIALYVVRAISGSAIPIIGILAQETYIVSHLFTDKHDSYISASYVKFIESAGGRVVPVWIGQPEDYYQRIVNYTNGILFPGGGTFFNETKGYGEAAKQIYKYAIQANKKGIYYPILGTCLGMEVIPFAALGTDIRVHCLCKNVALSLNLSPDYENSRIFSKAPKSIINKLSLQNLTFNYHRYCLTEEALKDSHILSDWKLLASNEDINKLKFISLMEHTRYPLYGIQFHPEKNQFEFETKGVPHSRDAVLISQYFSNFFVEEARKNDNRFPDKVTEKESLIYNYNPQYTGIKERSSYEQIYLFNISKPSLKRLLD